MIIGLGHTKQVGKDTAAKAMYSEDPNNICLVSLAGPLYNVCHSLCKEFRTKRFYDSNPEYKSRKMLNGLTPREVLISIGQDIKSVLGDRVWVDLALDKFKKSKKKHLIISDVRYKAEVEALKELDAKFILVTRWDLTHIYDHADDDLSDWGGWDYYLENDGSLIKFISKAKNMWRKLDAG